MRLSPADGFIGVKKYILAQQHRGPAGCIFTFADSDFQLALQWHIQPAMT